MSGGFLRVSGGSRNLRGFFRLSGLLLLLLQMGQLFGRGVVEFAGGEGYGGVPLVDTVDAGRRRGQGFLAKDAFGGVMMTASFFGRVRDGPVVQLRDLVFFVVHDGLL